MKKDEALELALEALKRATNYDPVIARAITAIKETLAQEQEPAAYPKNIGALGMPVNVPVTPPQRTWVGLTEEDISEIVRGTHNTGSFVRAITAKLKEKNT